jgi:hypothetical protein
MEMQAAARVDERKAGGFGIEPETVLPSQFFDRVQIDASLQPEKRLMLAVLEDAVGVFQKYVNVSIKNRRGHRMFVEAEEWFASNDTSWPYAFVNVCQALGLEPGYVRGGLWRWREGQRSVKVDSGNVVRFPFRRVNGTRHSITGRAVGLRRSA